jgi:RNA polymerase sigma-70 factor (ECF subfamily)
MQALAFHNQGIAQREVARDDYDRTFSNAYETYYARVFAFVYSRVRDPEVAKDIVSAVFERAYRKGRTVRDAEAYGSWLFMIARNVIAGHFRKAGREQRHLERAGDQLRFVDPPAGPEESLLKDERIGHMMDCLHTLPPRDRELLSLKFDAELTNAEIAPVVGMTGLNVRVAIFRALKKLRARMEANAAGVQG